MKINSIKNQLTTTTLAKPGRQENYQATTLKSAVNIPSLVVPTENTKRLFCTYLPNNSFELMDGLEPKLWQDALEVRFNTKANDGVKEGPLTFIRFAWTDELLFFYVEVEQVEKEFFVDNDKVWVGNNIEFLISPRWYDRAFYDEYEFLFNSQQACNSLYWTQECTLTEALSRPCGQIEWKTRPGLFYHKELKGWSLMGKVPFSDFETQTPLPGDYWGLGLFRKSFNQNGTVLLQAWSPPLNDPPKFHTPTCFGMLVFTKDDSRP